MACVWVTIPTRGRSTLAGAIKTCGVPRDRVVVVATAPGVEAPGCHVLTDDGPINIHRWWNTGINFAAERGATHVAVLNDDVRLGPGALDALVSEMAPAALATVGTAGLVTDTRRPRVLDGACWVLDLSTGLRADEGYRWWFGDDDLDWRARRDHGGVIALPVPYTHLRPNGYTSDNPALQALAAQDATRWAQQRAAA